MSKYRVKSGFHVVKGEVLRAGDMFSVDAGDFLTGERAAFFEKVEEKEATPPKNKKSEASGDQPPAGDQPPDKKGKKEKKNKKGGDAPSTAE